MCNFEGTTVIIMENHILEKHFKPDGNNRFSCDECSYNCDDREQLRGHFKEKHRDDSRNNGEDENVQNGSSDEESNLKEELRMLRNNFQRLEVLFQDSLEEVSQVRSEYEGKLIEANDRFRVVKAENEELKEKVDILFKLGRSYINRKETPTNNEKEKPKNTEDDIETVTIEDVTEDEDLQTWTQSKMRGFRRVGPASSAAKNPHPKPSPSSGKPQTNTTRKSPAAEATATGATATSDGRSSYPTAGNPPPVDPKPSHHSGTPTEQRRTLYCHYFSNFGKCMFEERTGKTCRFEHKTAPVCQSGMACQRSKCMYTHPNVGGISMRNPFLEQNNSFPHNINPWQTQMMNPWMNTNQFPSPWNVEMRRN